MKLAIIFVLLTTTTVKENEACQDSQRPIRYHHPPEHAPNPIQRPRPRPPPRVPPSIPRYEPIPMTDIRQARIFKSDDDESQWQKDHEILPKPESVELSKRTTFDASVREMQTTVELFLLSPFRDTKQDQDPFRDPIPHLKNDPKCVVVKTFQQQISVTPLSTGNSWDNFFALINNCHMYPENSDEIIQDLLDDMASLTVTKVENFAGGNDTGTQIKLKLTFENGKQALFKPMRFGIEYENDPNVYYHTEVERPNAEIAAFHLDKSLINLVTIRMRDQDPFPDISGHLRITVCQLLSFRSAVPTVGRVFTISTELKNAENHGVGRFTPFDSFDVLENDLCFFGTCMQYCDRLHALCGVEDKIRGSVQAWLPVHTDPDAFMKKELYLDYELSPYKRTYTYKRKDADWQRDKDYCKKNLTKSEDFKNGRRMLDVVDLSIFDFLTGNQDRHGYEIFSDLSGTDKSFYINLDNGRGFGNPHPPDDMDILAPLIQCCVVRPSTVLTLLEFYNEKTTLAKELVKAMEKADTTSKFGPVLAHKYLIAIDRRHEIVLKKIAECVKKFKPQNVLKNNMKETLSPQAVAVQKRIENELVNPKKRDERLHRRPIISTVSDQLDLIDFPVVDRESHNEEPTQKRITANNIAETVKKGQWHGSMQVGYSSKNDRVMTREGVKNEIPRPQADTVLVEYLSRKLPPLGDNAYKTCPKEVKQGKHEIQSEPDAWSEFFAEISNCHLYKNGDKMVQTLKDITKTMHPILVEQIDTQQFAAILTYDALMEAIFKPKRFDRNYESNPNHFYFEDFERHHAEIAAFHLDKLLGFFRVPPTIGQRIHTADDFLLKQQHGARKTMIPFISPAANVCFYSFACAMYCDNFHAYCGKAHMIEGSLQIWTEELRRARPVDSPYKKEFSQDDFTITSRRNDDSYCNTVLKKEPLYKNGRFLLDLVDLHIFDYLTGNQDRDQLHLFNFKKGNFSDDYIIAPENGKAFGNPHEDDKTILAPLTQCCIVRPSTVKTLLDFYKADVSLGEQLDNSLAQDLLYPILARKYLFAINRRVEIVLQEVRTCLENAEKTHRGPTSVLMNSFGDKQKGSKAGDRRPWNQNFGM